MDSGIVMAAIARMVIYSVPLALALRFGVKHWPILVACWLALGANIVLISHNPLVAGLVALPAAALNAYIFIERMSQDPHTLRILLGSKEAAWARERHDLRNELAALAARLHVYEGATDGLPHQRPR